VNQIYPLNRGFEFIKSLDFTIHSIQVLIFFYSVVEKYFSLKV